MEKRTEMNYGAYCAMFVIGLILLSLTACIHQTSQAEKLMKASGGIQLDESSITATVVSTEAIGGDSGLVYYRLAVESTLEPGTVGYFTQAVGPATLAESSKVDIKTGIIYLEGEVHNCAFVVSGDKTTQFPTPAVSGLGSSKDKEVANAK